MCRVQGHIHCAMILPAEQAITNSVHIAGYLASAGIPVKNKIKNKAITTSVHIAGLK